MGETREKKNKQNYKKRHYESHVASKKPTTLTKVKNELLASVAESLSLSVNESVFSLFLSHIFFF